MFLMHATAEGWLVAGVESKLPLPGWPPASLLADSWQTTLEGEREMRCAW
jgi:hypothetical protein